MSPRGLVNAQARPARESWYTIVNHFGDLVNFQ